MVIKVLKTGNTINVWTLFILSVTMNQLRMKQLALINI